MTLREQEEVSKKETKDLLDGLNSRWENLEDRLDKTWDSLINSLGVCDE